MRVLVVVFVACCAVAIAGEWDSDDMDVVPLQGAWGHEGQHPGEAEEALGDQVLLQDYSRQLAGRRGGRSKAAVKGRRRVKVTKAAPGAKPSGIVRKAPPGAKPGVIVRKAPTGAKKAAGAKPSVKVTKAPAGAKPGVSVRKVNPSTAKSSPLLTVEKAPSGAKAGVFITPVKPGSSKDQKARADLKHAKAALATAKVGIKPGMVITLRAGRNGRYCTSHQCASITAGAMEKMLVVDAGDGYLALRSGDHTCGGKCGKKHVDDAASQGKASKLKISVLSPGKLTIKLKGGGFCRHTSALKSKFACDALKVGPKTIFGYIISKGSKEETQLGEGRHPAGGWLMGQDQN